MDEQLMYDSTWLDEAVVQEAQIYPEALRQSKAERQPNFGGWMPQSQHEFNKLRDDTEQRKAMATKVGAYIGGGGIFKLHQQQEPQVQINFTGWSQGGICGIVTLDGKVFAFDWPLNEPIVLAQRLQWLADWLNKMGQPIGPTQKANPVPVPENYQRAPDLEEYVQQREAEEAKKKALEESIIESHRTLRDLLGL